MSKRKFSLKPHPDMVIIVEDEVKEVTDGGIILSDEAKLKERKSTNRGVIEFAGTNVSWLSVGDYVSFYKNASTELKVDGEVFSEVHEAHVNCVIEGLTEKK